MNPDQRAPAWFDRLVELINAGFNPDDVAEGGAQLRVIEPDGATIRFRQPLARHARLDTDCVWIRPIVGNGPGFDLHEACRRRGLPTTIAVTHSDDSVTFTLGDDAHAIVSPADPDQLDALDNWDTYILATLTAEEEAAAEALDGDSWYYPH